MRLSKNFTLEELTASSAAYRLGINNQPDHIHYKALENLCADILQPIRERYGEPIKVTSGFRCPQLNKAVGGVPGSDHCKGLAADIVTLEGTAESNRKLFALIVQMIKEGTIKVKQLIDEHNYSWIHISSPECSANKKFNEILHI